jgi:hypothetical protein
VSSHFAGCAHAAGHSRPPPLTRPWQQLPAALQHSIHAPPAPVAVPRAAVHTAPETSRVPSLQHQRPSSLENQDQVTPNSQACPSAENKLSSEKKQAWQVAKDDQQLRPSSPEQLALKQVGKLPSRVSKEDFKLKTGRLGLLPPVPPWIILAAFCVTRSTTRLSCRLGSDMAGNLLREPNCGS